MKAIEEVKKFYIELDRHYLRSKEEEDLLKLFKEKNVNLTSVSSRRTLLLIAQPIILKLIEEKIINFRKLIKLNIAALEYFCNDGEITEWLKERDITFDVILNLLDENNLPYYIRAKGNFSTSYILEKYEENPLHLQFMASIEDELGPTDVVYENSHDEEVVKFGMKHYDIEIEIIRGEIYSPGDHYAALADFDRMIGWDEDYEGDSCDEEDNCEEEDNYEEEGDYDEEDEEEGNQEEEDNYNATHDLI